MIDRKVTVEIKTSVTMLVPEGIEISEVVSGMACEVTYSGEHNVAIEDVQILGHEVTDSK